jgi:hypothetical protein
MPSGKPSGDRIIWDEKNDRRILLSYIMVATENNPGTFKANWDEVVKRSGLGVTTAAIQ